MGRTALEMAEQWGDAGDDKLDPEGQETVDTLNNGIEAWVALHGEPPEGYDTDDEDDIRWKDSEMSQDSDFQRESDILDGFADDLEQCRVKAVEQVSQLDRLPGNESLPKGVRAGVLSKLLNGDKEGEDSDEEGVRGDQEGERFVLEREKGDKDDPYINFEEQIDPNDGDGTWRSYLKKVKTGVSLSCFSSLSLPPSLSLHPSLHPSLPPFFCLFILRSLVCLLLRSVML